MAAGDLPPHDTYAAGLTLLAFVHGMTVLAKAGNDPDLIRAIGPAELGDHVVAPGEVGDTRSPIVEDLFPTAGVHAHAERRAKWSRTIVVSGTARASSRISAF